MTKTQLIKSNEKFKAAIEKLRKEYDELNKWAEMMRIKKDRHQLASLMRRKDIISMKGKATKIKNRFRKGMCGYCGISLGGGASVVSHMKGCHS